MEAFRPAPGGAISDGTFKPGDQQEKGVKTTLDELTVWATALKPTRAA